MIVMRHSKSKAPTTITYYSTLHDSITSLCKTILPLGGFKKRFLVSTEHRRSDNLKWQQQTFHQMIKLISLCREDIVTESEVSAFRIHLLDTLLASQQDHPFILRDKLVFLQELLNAKCISEGEYHSSKRPLLQRLETQGGGDIEGNDVIIDASKDTKHNSEEEWSVIDLKDDQCLVMNKENSNSKKEKLSKARKQIKEAASVFGFGSSYKPQKNSTEKSIFDSPSLHMHSTHSKIPPSKKESRESKENNPFWDNSEKCKRKPFKLLFQRKNREGHSGGDHDLGVVDENEVTPLSLNEKSDSEAYLASYQLGENSMKNKLHFDTSPSKFCIVDKVSRDKLNKNKELSIIKTESWSTNTNLKPLCNQYGVVLEEVVEKELKDQMRKDAEEKHELSNRWTTFEDDENLHPNLFVHNYNSLRSSSINPLCHG